MEHWVDEIARFLGQRVAAGQLLLVLGSGETAQVTTRSAGTVPRRVTSPLRTRYRDRTLDHP